MRKADILKRVPSAVDLFVKAVSFHCKQVGVRLTLAPTQFIKLNKRIQCAGYFSDDGKKLVVAIGHPSWVEVLAHEYCHMTQWLDPDCQPWKNYAALVGSGDVIAEWLNGHEVDNIHHIIDATKWMELDNEIRSLKVIQDFGLDAVVDTSLYVRKANAYVLWYNRLKTTRRWSKPNNSPYRNPAILAAMSTAFDMHDDYDRLSPELTKLFEQEGL